MPDLLRGNTIFTQNAKGLENYIEELNLFIKKLKIKRFNLIGFSMGGFLAINHSLRFPYQIDKLLVISTPVARTELRFKLARLVIGYFKLLFHNFFTRKGFRVNLLWIFDGLINFIKHPRQMFYDGLIATKDYEKHIDEMLVRTKVLFSNQDEFVPLSVMGGIKDIKNLEKTIINGNHSWFFINRRRLLNEINSFLDQN
jgi:pimeloyl-ACP methyl ester carboxylesterase